MINRENYEIWFIDFLDGNLNTQQQEMLKLFLTQHPDLATELDEIQQLSIEPENITYKGKANLKKHSLQDEEAFNQACVDFVEGDATNEQKAALLALTQTNAEKAKALQQFKATKLKAETVIYPYKEKLYKKAALLIPTRWIAVAATLTGLVIASLIWLNLQKQPDVILVADQVEIPIVDNNETIEAEESTQTMEVETADIEEVEKVTKESLPENTIQAKSSNTKASSVNTPPTPIEMSKLAAIESPRLNSTYMVFVQDPLNKVPQVDIQEPESKGFLAEIFKNEQSQNQYIAAAEQVRNVRVAPSLLNLLSEVSSERLKYTEKDNGEISNISYESKLLSFSVPIKSNKN